MNWIIIALIIIVLLVLLKLKYIKHKIFLIIFLLILLFLYTSVSVILVGEDIDINSLAGIEKAGKLYFNWLTNAFGNLRTLTTSAIRMDWQINNTKD